LIARNANGANGLEKRRAWDLLIVGGGITGAGILREAARLGLRALAGGAARLCLGHVQPFVEAGAWRLALSENGAGGLTRASVQGREQLLAEGPGLVDPLGLSAGAIRGDGATAGVSSMARG
jgi:glycerol-3-phosphate dehydrogenase